MFAQGLFWCQEGSRLCSVHRDDTILLLSLRNCPSAFQYKILIAIMPYYKNYWFFSSAQQADKSLEGRGANCEKYGKLKLIYNYQRLLYYYILNSCCILVKILQVWTMFSLIRQINLLLYWETGNCGVQKRNIVKCEKTQTTEVICVSRV